MALVLEDGTVVAGANSYADTDMLDTYAEDRAITLTTGADEEGALVRATQALDATYRNRYSGSKVDGRDQSLEWPRTGATDADGETIDEDEIPIEVINATCELAIREMVEAGAALPDLERGGAVKRLKAGSVEIEYAGNATPSTVFQIVSGIMAGLVGGSVRAGYSGTTVRI